jgi:nitrate/TMAO reductase-like tetraheme cytochrome c subunit
MADNHRIQDLRNKWVDVQEKRRQLESEYNEMRVSLEKQERDFKRELSLLCEHEWMREAVMYSELYCKHCHVFKMEADRHRQDEATRQRKEGEQNEEITC